MVSAELGRLRRAVDDEAGAGQRLEGRADSAIRIVVMGPGEAAAQREDRGAIPGILHRKGFVGADAEFAAAVGDIPRAVVQRKGTAAGDDALGIGRQAERGGLSGHIGRDADAAIDKGGEEAVAGFDAAREGVGVEFRMQAIDACRGHGTVGGDVLPAIGEGAGDIGLAYVVAREGAHLKEVGTPAAAVGDTKAGAAAGSEKPAIVNGEKR